MAASVVLGILTTTIGPARVALREHHIGDVLGGYVLGAAWVALCAFLGMRGRRPNDEQQRAA